MRYSVKPPDSLEPRLFLIYLFSLIVFLAGNLAWKILSFIDWVKNKKLAKFLVFCSSLILILVPTLFIQSGTSWNPIQFIYYALFLLNLPLAIF